jgi:GT2 family glycosyltransferase
MEALDCYKNSSDEQKLGIVGIQLIDKGGLIQRNTARFPTPRSLAQQMIGLDRVWPRHFPGYFNTDWDHRDSREVDQVPGAFFLLPRRVFEELGGFDERFFMYFEDMDLAFRAMKAGWKTYYLASVNAFHQGGGTTEQVRANRLFYLLSSRILYVAKHFGRAAALEILLLCLTGEFTARIFWSIFHGSRQAVWETITGYKKFYASLPRLWGKVKDPYANSSPYAV